jgi:signal transduction histidine kinase
VTVDLVDDGSRLTLTIHDDGKGIDPAVVEGPESLGIFGMRERVRLLGGSFRVQGPPGLGTTISVVVPRQPPATNGTTAGSEPDP